MASCRTSRQGAGARRRTSRGLAAPGRRLAVVGRLHGRHHGRSRVVDRRQTPTGGGDHHGEHGSDDRPGAGALKFHLTIAVDDIARFGSDPSRQAGAFGWVESDALGGRLPVEHGVFNLFVDTEPGVKHMLYRLFFRDGVGHPLTMSGFKLVRDDAGFDVWRDTTTLFTRVYRGHVSAAEEESAELVASGVWMKWIWVASRSSQVTYSAISSGAGTR